MKLNHSGGKLTVNISGTFSAEEVEELINDLALARADMSPAVPFKPPTPGEGNPDQPILLEDDPSMNLALRVNGDFRLWVRSRGIGWMAFNLTLLKACGIRDYLIARTPAPDATSNFFREKDAGGHKPN